MLDPAWYLFMEKQNRPKPESTFSLLVTGMMTTLFSSIKYHSFRLARNTLHSKSAYSQHSSTISEAVWHRCLAATLLVSAGFSLEGYISPLLHPDRQVPGHFSLWTYFLMYSPMSCPFPWTKRWLDWFLQCDQIPIEENSWKRGDAHLHERNDLFFIIKMLLSRCLPVRNRML